MTAFLNNLGLSEMVVIALIAVLIFGKNLPQAASKAYLQIRKLRNAMEDIRRESGIDKEIRDIERTVREAEWEARRATRIARHELPGRTTQGPQESGAPASLPPPLPPPARPPDAPAEDAPEPEGDAGPTAGAS